MRERPCRRHRRRRRGRDLHAARRPLSRWLLPFSPVLYSKLLAAPLFLRVHPSRARASRKGWPPQRTVEIRELGFVLACYYVVYEHRNVARQGRKSIHERTGQYLPVKRHCTRIFPTGRVLYARLIHFALEPRPIAAPLWHATNDYQRTTVFHLFPNMWLLPPSSTFHLLVFFFCFFIIFYLYNRILFIHTLIMYQIDVQFLIYEFTIEILLLELEIELDFSYMKICSMKFVLLFIWRESKNRIFI